MITLLSSILAKSWKPALTLVVGIILIYFPLLDQLRLMPGDLGDTRLNIYFLEHNYNFFLGDLTSYWDAPFMYPENNTMALSDNLLGSGWIYGFFRLISLNPYNAFLAWFLTLAVLNFLSAYFLLIYLTKDSSSASIGAFIFAFSIALFSQLPHAQTFPRFAIPLAILFTLRFHQSYKSKDLFWSAFFFVWTIYCGIYLGMLFAIPFFLLHIFLLIARFRHFREVFSSFKSIRGAIAIILLNIFILLPLIIPYLERRITPSDEQYQRVFLTLPDLTAFFTSQNISLLWKFLTPDTTKALWWEFQLFPGFLAMVGTLFVLGWISFRLIKNRNTGFFLRQENLLMIIGFVFMVLFLRFGDFSFYRLIYEIPGFAGMRSMSRMINVQLIFFSLGAALFVSWVQTQIKFKETHWFFFVLLLVSVDNWLTPGMNNRTLKSEMTTRIEQYDSIFATIPKRSLVSLEPVSLSWDPIHDQLDAMLLSQKYQLTTVNGYTATSPADFTDFWFNPTTKNRMIWLGDKNIGFDSIYIIYNSKSISKISLEDELISFDPAQKRDSLIQNIIIRIKNDENWFRSIEQKAIENGIPFDSMLILDATWVYENP